MYNVNELERVMKHAGPNGGHNLNYRHTAFLHLVLEQGPKFCQSKLHRRRYIRDSLRLYILSGGLLFDLLFAEQRCWPSYPFWLFPIA